jgi:predicted RNA-binding Zn-ribbon protein involved in translation (DUF1610 family)
MDVRCLSCGRGFTAESDAAYRCPHCGWERRVTAPFEVRPAGPTYARGVFVGCLISAVLLAIGLFLLYALTPPPWGKE